MSINSKNISTYNKIADQFSESHFDPIFWRKEFEIFCDLAKGKKILEIGCGAGRDASLFHKSGFDYLGTDASKGMIKQAQTRLPECNFQVMDFYKLDFPTSTFDGFWACAALLHIPKPRLNKVLVSIKKIMKKGAVGFISIKQIKERYRVRNYQTRPIWRH